MKAEVILLPLMIFLSGCSYLSDKNLDTVECNVDSDCSVVGCSSQLCVVKENAEDIITTCEYREEYSCLKLTSCGCVDNKCQWNNNEEYLNCIGEVRA